MYAPSLCVLTPLTHTLILQPSNPAQSVHRVRRAGQRSCNTPHEDRNDWFRHGVQDRYVRGWILEVNDVPLQGAGCHASIFEEDRATTRVHFASTQIKGELKTESSLSQTKCLGASCTYGVSASYKVPENPKLSGRHAANFCLTFRQSVRPRRCNMVGHTYVLYRGRGLGISIIKSICIAGREPASSMSHITTQEK